MRAKPPVSRLVRSTADGRIYANPLCTHGCFVPVLFADLTPAEQAEVRTRLGTWACDPTPTIDADALLDIRIALTRATQKETP